MVSYEPKYSSVVAPDKLDSVDNFDVFMAKVKQLKESGKTVAIMEIITFYFDNVEPLVGDFQSVSDYDHAVGEYEDERGGYLGSSVSRNVDVSFDYMVFDSFGVFEGALAANSTMFSPSSNSVMDVECVGDGEYYGEDIDALNERAWKVYITVV